MRTPDLEWIRRERAEGNRGCGSYATMVHNNPRFYKYYWWVFWSESPVDGDEFLSKKYRLSTVSAMELVAELEDRGEPCWLYNERLPRHDPANPFDTNHSRWQDTEWALAYDDDPDPIAPDPLAGYK